MAEQGQQVVVSGLVGGIPMGRGLMPEEIAEFKARGREWSRLYKEKRRKEFTPEQVEERKLKNRLRQKRFRERQKSREQEEVVRLATAPHAQQSEPHQHHHHHQIHHAEDQQPQHQAQQPQQHSPQQHAYDPAALQHYTTDATAHNGSAKLEQSEPEGLDDSAQPQETLVEKRKRLGRERQARFREKKRVRGPQQQLGGVSDGTAAGLASAAAQSHHEIMTLTELQKMSAQLSGYYTGLTQGLSQEEHQAVMRFFLDNIREELGDEVFGGPPAYSMADAQAQAAAAQAQYMVAGQPGLDLQALQAAAAAHMQPADMQAHLQAHHQGGQVEHGGHMPSQHLQGHLSHQAQLAGGAEAAHEVGGELTQAQLEAYHRQLAEHQAQQAAMGPAQHHDESYEHQSAGAKGHSQDPSGPSQLPSGDQPGIMYGQAGVHQDMLQGSNPLQYVDANTGHP